MGRSDFEATATAAWLDVAYDRDFASDGRSRFGSYLRDRASWWADDEPGDDPEWTRVRSAARCWDIANGPIMAPALVTTHPRVLAVTAAASEYDGRDLVLTARLVTGLPEQLRRALGGGWRGWQRQRSGIEAWWAEPGDGYGRPVRMALPTLALSWPVPAAELPALRPGVPAVCDAIGAVASVADAANRQLRSVLAALDS
jgi:hypothetical protein